VPTLTRAIRLSLCLALLTGGALMAGPVQPAAAVGPDAREAGQGDDTLSDAVDMTAYVAPDKAWFGAAAYTELRTFDFVDDDTATSDEDWIKFVVSPADFESGEIYLVEAVPTDTGNVEPLVDPVIEVYGPGIPTTVTAPGALGESSETPGTTETDPHAKTSNDDAPWFASGPMRAGRGASVGFIPEAIGTYYVRIRPFYMFEDGDTPGFRDGVGGYTLRVKVGLTTRIAGADRIGTAIAASQERFRSGGSPTVVIASGYAFPDALSGSTLAGALAAPMLLTNPTVLPSTVEAEIRRLGAADAYILGGTGAVSAGVENRLKTLLGAGAVHRVAGRERTETALRVALAANAVRPVAKVAFIANAYNYPDALSASPMAAFNVAPVLLTQPDSLVWATRQAIKDLGITDVVIVGGTGVVSARVESELASILGGSSHVRRVAGATRYQTSAEFAIWATGAESGGETVGTPANPNALAALAYDRIAIASGENYPDALSGGVFCGLGGAPVLLSASNSWSPFIYDYGGGVYRTYYSVGSLAIMRSYVLGGPGALADWIWLSADLITGSAL